MSGVTDQEYKYMIDRESKGQGVYIGVLARVNSKVA